MTSFPSIRKRIWIGRYNNRGSTKADRRSQKIYRLKKMCYKKEARKKLTLIKDVEWRLYRSDRSTVAHKCGTNRESESPTEFEPMTVCGLANYCDCRTVSQRWKKVWLKQIPTVYSFSYLLFGDNILVTLGHSWYQNPRWNATSQLFPVHKRKKALDNLTMYIKHALWSTEFKRPWCNIKIRASRFQVCSKFNSTSSSMF